MSKSKLNGRQLKKISKIACDALISLGFIDCCKAWFDERESEWVVGWGENFTLDDYWSCSDELWDIFQRANTIKNPDPDDDLFPELLIYPKGFESLSEANQIHYMIKFLEASNEN